MTATAAFGQAQPTEWPRVRTLDGTRVVLHQPQIDSWVFYTQLKARLAVEITPEGSSETIVGALRVHAATRTDLESRRVLISDVEIVDASFPTLDAGQEQEWQRWLASLLRRSPQVHSLDEVLAYMEHAEATAVAAQPPTVAGVQAARASAHGGAPTINMAAEPPSIYFSQKPAILVVVDGQPARFPIDGTDLSFVVNTNWTLLFERSTERYFLLNGDSWLTASTLEGPWGVASQLPSDLSRLPAGKEWAEVSANVPGRRVSAAEVPVVFTSTEPAELILVAGEPDLQTIPGTGLFHVANTASDLFVAKSDGRYYYLVSGRWFAGEDLRGPWSFATPELPADFKKIPADHPRGHVLAAVPGTPQAEEAVLLAQMPTKATVKRDEATADVVYQGPPEFSSIEGTTIAYAVNTSSDVLKIDGRFYLCFRGVWFVSASAHGPWVVVDTVPAVVYTIPPSSPVHHLTYVYVYDSTPDVVVVGYTPGYLGLYVSWGCVVWGTGYYYPPYVYRGPYPVYYPYPYSYGAAAYYNPATGTYARGAAVYGPYGGAARGVAYNPATGTRGYAASAYGPYGGVGRAAAYNPTTGTYARGAAAWGPEGGTAAYQAYNPRTDTARTGYQSANAYSQWGESVVQRGDDWVRTGHYTDSRGTVAGFETSQGGRGVGVQTDEGRAGVAKGANDNLYAGKDGNVYKKSDSGWSTYDDGSWSQIESPGTAAERQAQAQGRASERRSDASAAGSDWSERASSFERGANQRDVVNQLDREARARAQGAERGRRNSAGRSGGRPRGRG
jgi:hypothetical protein